MIRDLWRRFTAALGGRWHIPDEADMLRLVKALSDRTDERDKAQTAVRELTDRLSVEMARADAAERSRDAWRRRAERVPLDLVDEDTARRERHAEARRTGGR